MEGNKTENVTKYFDILPPSLAIQAMRSNGYKDTAYAVAELIDNSLQAGEKVPHRSTEVEVVCIERPIHFGERTIFRVSEIAIYDNASGMDIATLREAMQFGQGTNLDLENQKGIGKFGMGLPNASISQCKRLDVYSWQHGICHHTYLDIGEISEGAIREVPYPQEVEIPTYWKELLASEIQDSGTLVVWKQIDRATWAKSRAFFKNAEFIIGRMYRYFLAEGKARIRFAAYSDAGGNSFSPIDEFYVRPNDPMMLMKNTMAPEPFTEVPAFDQWGEPDDLIVQIGFNRTSKVTIRYSVATEEARDTGALGQSAGSKPLGKFVAKNLGVSIVRASRELELNKTWNNPSEPRERWWGVEISFDPSLDDVFGVTNDKQSATKLIRSDLREDAQQEDMSVNEFTTHLVEAEDPKYPIYQISNAIDKRLSEMKRHIIKQKEGQNIVAKGVPGISEAEARASIVTSERVNKTGKEGRSDNNSTATDEKKVEAIKEALEEAGAPMQDAQKIAVQSVERDLKYFFTNTEHSSPAFFDVQEKSGMLFTRINTKHPAYDQFFALLENDGNELSEDNPALTGLKLLLTAWARMEDEAPERDMERLQEIRIKWGQLAREFMQGEAKLNFALMR